DDGVGRPGCREPVDRLLAHAGRRGTCGDDIETLVAQLAFQTAGAEDQHAVDVRVVLAQVGRRRAGARHDGVGRDGCGHRTEARLVVGAVVDRVFRDGDDVVATGRTIGQDRGPPRDWIGATVDDA